MTRNEAVEKLRAYHKCQRLQVKGIYEDCNEKLCDNCDLCYAQGNTGEHIKSIEIAIQALEKHIPKKPIEIDTYGEYYKCPICNKYIVDNFGCGHKFCREKFCRECGQAIDWSEQLRLYEIEH